MTPLALIIVASLVGAALFAASGYFLARARAVASEQPAALDAKQSAEGLARLHQLEAHCQTLDNRRAAAEDALSQQRAARAEAQQALSDERAARAEAQQALSDERAARAEAQQALSDERAARAEAQQALSDERTARAEAQQALSQQQAAQAAAQRSRPEPRDGSPTDQRLAAYQQRLTLLEQEGRQRATALVQQRDQLQLRLSRLEQESVKLQQQRDQAVDHQAQLQQQIRDLERKAHQASLRASVSGTIPPEPARFQQELELSAKEVRELSLKLTQERAAASRASKDLRGQLDEIKHKLARATEQGTEQANQLRQLGVRVAQAEKLAEQRKRELARVDQQLRQAEKQPTVASSLKQERERLARRVSELEAQLEHQQQALDTRPAAAPAGGHIAELQGRLAAELTRSTSPLDQQLSELRRTIAEQTRELLRLRPLAQQAEQLRHQLDLFQRDVETAPALRPGSDDDVAGLLDHLSQRPGLLSAVVTDGRGLPLAAVGPAADEQTLSAATVAVVDLAQNLRQLLPLGCIRQIQVTDERDNSLCSYIVGTERGADCVLSSVVQTSPSDDPQLSQTVSRLHALARRRYEEQEHGKG